MANIVSMHILYSRLKEYYYLWWIKYWQNCLILYPNTLATDTVDTEEGIGVAAYDGEA